jgi:hypothetical protein
MTQDFLHDFCQSCDTEGWNYIVIMAPPHTNDVSVSFSLDNWQGHPKRTRSQDIVDILTCAGLIDPPDQGQLPP